MELETNANHYNFFSCQSLQLDMDLFMETDTTISPKSNDGKQFLTMFDDKKQQITDFDRFCEEEFNLSEQNYSIYQNIGGQRKMLDRFSKHQFINNGEIIEFYGIFDGHGNSFIAEYLSQNLHQKLQNHKEILSNPCKAINEIFQEIDNEMLQKMSIEQENSGSTALCVLLTPNQIITINLGDSRAILIDQCNDNFEQLTDDLKPSRPDEKQRIEELEGGYVIPVGKVLRVQGVLAVSRSFGNKRYRPYISAEPEIRIYQRNNNGSQQKLLLATDGLFNESSNENIVQKINQLANEPEISQKLYEKILEENEYIKDNTTIMIIDI